MIRATVILAALATSTAASAAPTAGEIVDNIQKYYAKVDHVDAKFRQEVTNDITGTSKTSDGTVFIQKPGKMRWDYSEKLKDKWVVKKSFISNGSQLWVVEHDNKQVIKKNLQQDLMPVAVSFLYGKGDLKTEFNAEIDPKSKLGGTSDIVLKLTPKKASAQYKNLYLVVNATDFHVSQSQIVDASNNTNRIRFFEPDLTKAEAPTVFEYNEKEASKSGYRIVDADQQGSNTPAGATDLGPPTSLPKKP
jgi:outer membrane lipoprotein carrier protein